MLDCGEGRHLVDVSLSDQPIQATERQTCILVIIPILNFITSNLYLSYELYILLYILFLTMIRLVSVFRLLRGVVIYATTYD